MGNGKENGNYYLGFGLESPHGFGILQSDPHMSHLLST